MQEKTTVKVTPSISQKKTINVTVKEPSTVKKLFSNFIQGDFKTVGIYLVHDLILPTIKDTFIDAMHSSIDILFNGESRYSRLGSIVSRNRTNYSSISSSRNGATFVRGDELRNSVIKEVIFEDAQTAEDVLNELCLKIEAEGCCSVADYYEICNQKSSFTDHKWGWDSLAMAKTRRVGGGYIINLPRPIAL